MRVKSWEVHKVSSSQNSKSKQGQNNNELCTAQIPFLAETLSAVRAHNSGVRF